MKKIFLFGGIIVIMTAFTSCSLYPNRTNISSNSPSFKSGTIQSDTKTSILSPPSQYDQ